jgi:hypothetical protein
MHKDGASWSFQQPTQQVSQYIHILAPHPKANVYTPKQAVVLFKKTGAKSLFIAGRHRDPFPMKRACVNHNYSKPDPTHEVVCLFCILPFINCNLKDITIGQAFLQCHKAICLWQIANGGCPAPSCAYLQMHGKKSTTCSDVDIFLSAGLGTCLLLVRDFHASHLTCAIICSVNSSWYTEIPDSPVRQVKFQLETAIWPARTIFLPSDNSCTLTATQNVFGRLLNGVPESSVCTLSSNNASGEFIHIKQNSASREDGWQH